MKADLHATTVTSTVEIAWPDRLVFWLLAASLCVRPLISESFEQTSLSFLPDAFEGVSANATIWLDGLLLVIGATAWLRRPPRGMSVWLVGFLLLLAAVIVSTAAADARRIALNAGSNLIVAVWAAGALTRVTRTRCMVHLLLAAFLAAGVANAAKCYFQYSEEFGATLESWLERKAALAAEGADVDSPMIVNYERRLRSRQAFGYLSHPNVAAACMNMSLMLALGLLGGVLRKPGLDWNQRGAALAPAVAVIALLIWALYLTGSNGAFVAGMIGALFIAFLGTARAWVARHRRVVFAVFLAGYAGVVGGAAGYGWFKGTLPHTSLAFRWQYWTAAARAIEEAPLTGIGRENFRAAYLRFKPAESTEEVANPHDLWVTLLTELGPLGLCAGVILLISAYRRALRSLDFEHKRTLKPPASFPWLDAAAVALGVLVMQAIFTSLPLAAPGVFIVWCVYFVAVWITAFVIGRMLLTQADESPASSGWIAAGLIAALSATLIHELIEFTLFTPAGAASVAVLSAAAIGWNAQQREQARVRATWRVGVIVGIIALPAAYGFLVVRPTIGTQREWTAAKNELRHAGSEAAGQAVLARFGEPAAAGRACWNATVPQWAAQTAEQLAGRSGVPLDERRRWLDVAQACAARAGQCVRHSFSLEYLTARIEQDRAALTGDGELLSRAEERWRTRVIPLYPTNPFVRITTGDLEYQLWHATKDAAYAKHAIENYEQALAIDATRAPEVADKLPAEAVEAVRSRVEELWAAGEASP